MNNPKPYLQLRERISQTWFNKYTIALTLIALKIVMFHNSLNNSLQTTKNSTLNSCSTIDSYASNAISIPHYLSKSANYMISKSLEEMNERTKDALKLILTGSEQLILFSLEMIIGTYACVLVSTVDGAVDVAVNSTETIISWVNDTLGDITDDIETGLTDLSKILNKVVQEAEEVKSFFTGDEIDSNSTFNKVNLTISSLKSLSIPTSINSKLEELKQNTPDFDTVLNKTQTLIKTPFELVKTKISNSSPINSDKDDLYVPPLSQSTICSDNTDKINDFYHKLAKDISIAVKVIVVLLIISAILAIIPSIYEEWKQWRKLKTLQRETDIQIDPIESFEKVFNKYPTKFGMFFSSKLKNSNNQTTIRWIISYVFSNRSLIILGIALVGVLVVISQFIILHLLIHSIKSNKTPFQAITKDLSNDVSYAVFNWTNSTNEYISNKETLINQDLFSWVQTATESVNNTISAFVDEMDMVINDAFNGTILYAPIKTIVGCVIERKLIKIEEGLTWIHDNAEISFPRIDESYITSGFDDSSNTTSLTSKASVMVKDAENQFVGLLELTIKQYKKTIMFELYISLSILALWTIQILIALLMCWYDGKFNQIEQQRDNSNDRNKLTLDEKKFQIGYPTELSKEQKEHYGYPLTLTENLDSRTISLITLKNPFEPEDPFKDPKAVP